MNRKVLLILPFFLSVSSHLFAADCDKEMQSANQFYKCALEKDPRIRALAAREKERAGRTAEAKQFPNPVGEFEATKDEISGSIVQPLEIGGKRSARIDVSEIENETSTVEGQLERGEISLELAQSLNRYHQQSTRLDLLEDTKRSLVSLTGRLRAKAVRTPEERVAVGLFSMQNTLIETRILAVKREITETKARLEASIGRKLTSKDQLGLSERRSWPSADYVKPSESLNQRLKALNVRRLEGELKVQRSLAWPDLAIGPYFKQDRTRDESSVGAKLEFGLPLWNRNSGAKQRAEGEFERAKITSGHTFAHEKLSLEALAESYRSLVGFLAQSASSKELHKSVKETLSLFARGMVQPSNVIETYRSAFETMEAVQDAEAAALEQYWMLQIAGGSIPKEIP
ncbi:MAG: TolC family protein [Bdellovibrionales bacterium]|nr:TolC family protein [Bdellovibrionales bacterium]